MAKLAIILTFCLFYPINSYSNIQFYNEDVEFIFELNNEKKIFIVRQGNINSIFEYDNKSKKFQYINKIDTFVGLVKECAVETSDYKFENSIAGYIKNYYLSTGSYYSELLLFPLGTNKFSYENSLGAFPSYLKLKKNCQLYKNLN